MDVRIIGVEASERIGQATVERIALITNFVAVDAFWTEAQKRSHFVVFATDTIAVEVGRIGTHAARIKAAALEALAEAGVDIVVWGWLKAQRYAGRELFEITLSAEVGAGSTKGDTCPAKEWRSAAEIVLAQDIRGALIPCVTAANRQAEPFGKVVGKITEDGVGFRIDRRLSKCRQSTERREQAHIEQGICRGIQIICTDHAAERTSVHKQLHFLADLFVEIATGDVDISRRQRVKIDGCQRVIFAPCTDGPQRQAIGQIHRNVHGEAISFDILFRINKSAACVKNIVQHGRARQQSGNDSVTAAWVAIVTAVIAADTHRNRRAISAKLQCAARSPQILVIIFKTSGQVIAKTAA